MSRRNKRTNNASGSRERRTGARSGQKVKSHRHPLRIGLQWSWQFESSRQIMRGALDYADKCDRWEVVWDIRYQRDFIRANHLDALIAMPIDLDHMAWLKRCRIPVVAIVSEKACGLLPLVMFDDRAIGRMAAEYLLNMGFEHLAYYSHANVNAPLDPRGDSFRDTATEAGAQSYTLRIKPMSPLPPVALEPSEGAMIRWLKSLPSPVGVFAYNDLDAIELAKVMHKADRRMPDDLALLGVDNDPLLCRLSPVALSSIDHGAAAVGRRAAAVLDDLLQGKPAPESPIRIPPALVVPRASTDTLALNDADVVAALRMIREEACDGLRAEVLIDRIAVSRSTLDSRFQAHLGRSVHQEILRVRMDKAKQLLIDTDLDLAQVTDRSGFKYPSQLCHLFRKHEGTTPGAYRLTMRTA